MSGPSRTHVRQIVTVLGLVALVASAVYGGDLFGVRTAVQGEAVPPERPAAGRTAAPSPTGTPQATRVRSHPWWQSVDTLSGDGPRSGSVTIDDDALQWRVSWSCPSGRLVVTTSGDGEPLADDSCAQEGVAYATVTGPVDLTVETDGAWELVVEQQVDVPLVEPPTAAMQDPAAQLVASGTFYDLDQTGRGTVQVHRLADGSHAVRLEDFFVSPNVDLEVRLSPLAAPETTAAYLSDDSVLVAGLEATAGSMNLAVPDGVDPADFGSVVIWCPPVDSAYAAATLRTGEES